MYLMIPDQEPRRNPSQTDVIAAIKAIDHHLHNSFLILVNERKPNSFFEIYRNSARLFEAEYAEGTPQRQYRAVKLSRRRVIELALAYFEGKNTFKQMNSWVEITDTVLLPEDHDLEEEEENDDEDTNATNPRKDNHMLDDLAGTASTLATQMATLLCNAGYLADYSLESLAEVDRVIDEYSHDGKAKKGGLLAPEFLPADQRTQMRLFSLGCYVGAVLCQLLDGHWEKHPEHPDRPDLWQVKLPSGSAFFPINKVFKRFNNGEADSLYGFGMVVVGLEQSGKQGG